MLTAIRTQTVSALKRRAWTGESWACARRSPHELYLTHDIPTEALMTEESFPFQVHGSARTRRSRAAGPSSRSWGLTMPAVEPLALDFGLGRFSEIGEIEFSVANQEAAGYCGKFLFVDDHQTCPYHRHDLKHETFFVMKGTVWMAIDGEEKVLRGRHAGHAARTASLLHGRRPGAAAGGVDAEPPERQFLCGSGYR